MEYIKGDLLLSEAHIIAHQTNCVTRKAHGLSALIAAKWPEADIYATRSGATENTASLGSRHEPGTCHILKTREGSQSVACLMGQVCPGPSGTWARQFSIASSDDSLCARTQLFIDALADLERQLPVTEQTQTIAFPFMIGCGQAGGDWSTYQPEIKAFANRVKPRNWHTQIVVLQNNHFTSFKLSLIHI